MSGPKVVRIVTIEEAIAICQGHFARFDQAINQWQKSMDKLGETDKAFYEVIRQKRQAIDRMLTERRFMDIQKLVPIEITFLNDDLMQRYQLKVAQKTQDAIEARQAEENIKSLVDLLNNKKIVISNELHHDLQAAMNGKYQGNINQLLTTTFNLLTPKETSALTQTQQTLLNRMAVDETTQTFAMWLEQHIQLQKDPYIQKIEGYLVELALEQETLCDVFVARLNTIKQEQPGSRQRLLLDSFVLDLAQAVKDVKERSALQIQLELLIAELQQKTTDPLDFDLKTLDTINIKELKVLIHKCEQTLSTVTQKNEAMYRQQAILQGLASLGYEVRQGMQTQWAKDGRLVLRNPATPGYGIELAGKAETARMQVRAVKLTKEQNQQRDTDIETLWCGDFAKLQQWLAKQGSDLMLEKALPVGAVALKSVTMEGIDALEIAIERKTLV